MAVPDGLAAAAAVEKPPWGRVALKVLLFSTGAMTYALLGILSHASKEEDGSYAYSPPSVAVMAEVVKLLLSSHFLRRERGSLGAAAAEVAAGGPWLWLAFAVPSLLYAIGNNLDMLNNLHMDPATEHVLVQGKVLTTGVLWWVVFRQPMGFRKWFSLLLLFVGGALAAVPGEGLVEASRRMHIDSVGIIFVTIHCCCSAGAGVYNEWLLKVLGDRRRESIHTANIRLYCIGCAMNLAAHWWGYCPDGTLSLLKGHNRYSLALVPVYACMGLVVSEVMKWFNIIVKLFMSGASMYITAAWSWLMFGFAPTANFTAALVVTTLSMLLFNGEKIQALFAEGSKGKAE